MVVKIISTDTLLGEVAQSSPSSSIVSSLLSSYTPSPMSITFLYHLSFIIPFNTFRYQQHKNLLAFCSTLAGVLLNAREFRPRVHLELANKNPRA
jgi:hypothetical protein